ncbi:MAG: substrate-binding domain-containing protein [Melioribacteraceae bacterium]
MKKYNSIPVILFVFAIIFNFGCKERHLSPTKGSLKCYVDESLYNVVKAARDSFVVVYPESKIELITVKAREGIASILNGDAKLFISSRNLNDEEKSFLKKQKTDVRDYKFCYDAVVPIVSEDNPKENVIVADLQKMLKGEIRNFSVFVPEHNSGVYEYLKTILLDKQEPQNVTIVKSEEETINRVRETKNGLGFVGLNTLENVKGVKILEVGSKVRSDGEVLYYKPYVAYLVTQSYPLIRTTAIFINDYGTGLAAGFLTYLTSYEGQKIVSKNNLGPATVPIKMVN